MTEQEFIAKYSKHGNKAEVKQFIKAVKSSFTEYEYHKMGVVRSNGILYAYSPFTGNFLEIAREV